MRSLRESLRGEPIRRVLGHRQRHDELHPHQDDRGGRRLRRGARRGAAARASPSATRPPTSRASTPAPRRRSSPRSRSAPGWSPATSTTRGSATSARPTSTSPTASATSSSCSRSPSSTRAAARSRVRVHPAMVPIHHPLASVRESFNAVFVEGGAVGSLMFYGRGAGGLPTASAVLGDVIDAAVNLTKGTHGTLGTFAKARDPADRRDVRRVPPRARGRRPTGRAPRRHRRVRRPRREHPRRRAGGHRRRRPAGVHHPRGQGVGGAGDACTGCASSTW